MRVKKCSLGVPEVLLLGNVVDGQRVRADPEKIRRIFQAPRQSNHTELSSFLGFTGYFRRFIKGFSYILSNQYAGSSHKLSFDWN